MPTKDAKNYVFRNSAGTWVIVVEGVSINTDCLTEEAANKKLDEMQLLNG